MSPSDLPRNRNGPNKQTGSLQNQIIAAERSPLPPIVHRSGSERILIGIRCVGRAPLKATTRNWHGNEIVANLADVGREGMQIGFRFAAKVSDGHSERGRRRRRGGRRWDVGFRACFGLAHESSRRRLGAIITISGLLS